MKLTVFILTFTICAGLSIMGIISSYRLKQQNHSFASSLFYYKVFLVAFGFYGIWSHLFFDYLLENILVSDHHFRSLTSIFPILGIPLLIVAWYLFIQFCSYLSSRKLSAWYTIGYFLSLVLAFLFVSLYFQKKVSLQGIVDLDLINRILAIINIIFILFGGIILLTKKRRTKKEHSPYLLLVLELTPFLLSTIALFMVSSHWFIVILTIMFYFSAVAILPAWLYFKSSLPEHIISNFAGFCSRFEISKRESEIIQEICKGKANKQIADSLFITIQTVKDHTHRIYLKTRVANRVQLSNLVNEFTS